MITKLIQIALSLRPIRTLFKKMRFGRLFSFVIDKYDFELSFQGGWAKEFKENKSKVLEYWKKYRYLDEINNICKIDDNNRVLDIGCGISTVLHYIKGERFGIDPLADEYFKLYNYPEGIKIQKGFGENISFSSQFFDVVFCSNVLDHTTDPQKTVDEIFRVLKNGGYFVLTVEVFESKKQRDLAHPHCFTKEDIFSLIGTKFVIIFENISPWIGLRAYINGSRESHNEELIMVLKKV